MGNGESEIGNWEWRSVIWRLGDPQTPEPAHPRTMTRRISGVAGTSERYPKHDQRRQLKERSMHKGDLLGRVIGIVVFLAGIGLLSFVFATAYSWFSAPSAALPTAPTPGSTAPATAQLGSSAVNMIEKIALLIVMTIVGSLLAGRGVQLYFASINAKPPAMAPKDD
jgi:hypothetical protein